MHTVNIVAIKNQLKFKQNTFKAAALQYLIHWIVTTPLYHQVLWLAFDNILILLCSVCSLNCRSVGVTSSRVYGLFTYKFTSCNDCPH